MSADHSPHNSDKPEVKLVPESRLPIGVFDSGLGGLRVLDRLMQAFPDEDFVYLGDTLYMPYGHKTREQVNQYVGTCLNWFFAHHPVKIMVVACNTAAAAASSQFDAYTPIPFVDPVTAMCTWLTETERFQKLGLMATPATVESNRYRTVLDAMGAKNIDIQSISCENLATVIEMGGVGTPECNALLAKYVSPLRQKQVEAIILGCTHYPYVHEDIAALAPKAIILDPDIYMVMAVEQHLKRLAAPPTQALRPDRKRTHYFVTDAPERFYNSSRSVPFQSLSITPPKLITPHAKTTSETVSIAPRVCQ